MVSQSAMVYLKQLDWRTFLAVSWLMHSIPSHWQKRGQTPPHFNELGARTFSEHFLSEPHKFNFSAPRVLLESVRGQQPQILQRIKNKFSHRDLLPLCPQLSQSILMICPLNGRLWTLLLTAPVSFASSLSSDEWPTLHYRERPAPAWCSRWWKVVLAEGRTMRRR